MSRDRLSAAKTSDSASIGRKFLDAVGAGVLMLVVGFVVISIFAIPPSYLGMTELLVILAVVGFGGMYAILKLNDLRR